MFKNYIPLHIIYDKDDSPSTPAREKPIISNTYVEFRPKQHLGKIKFLCQDRDCSLGTRCPGALFHKLTVSLYCHDAYGFRYILNKELVPVTNNIIVYDYVVKLRTIMSILKKFLYTKAELFAKINSTYKDQNDPLDVCDGHVDDALSYLNSMKTRPYDISGLIAAYASIFNKIKAEKKFV
jgi:hypothetical protein